MIGEAELLDPNITRAGPDWPAAVVACGHQTGVLFARNLEHRGVRVYVVDSNPDSASFRSVYGKPLLCPNPDSDAAAWVAYMLRLRAEIGGPIPALMAGSDQFVAAIGHNAAALAGTYSISRSAQLQAELALKEGQIRLATLHGLPIPRTCSASTLAEVEDFAASCSFPCLFKPQQHRYWNLAPLGHPLNGKKAIISNSRDELIANYHLAAAFSPDVTIQELIEGSAINTRVHVALYSEDGRRIGCCTTRALRALRLGGVSLSEPVDEPEVAEVCDRFFRAIGYTGICEIELKWDDRDGQVKMMDINPRYTGSGNAMPYAGLDQGWLHYLDLIGKPVQPVRLNQRSFRFVMLTVDAAAVCLEWFDRQLSLNDVWRSYQRPVYFYDFDPRDWRLAFATVGDVAKVVLLTAGKFVKSGFRRAA